MIPAVLARTVNTVLHSFGLEIRRRRDACGYLKTLGLSPKLIVDVGTHVGETIHGFRAAFPNARVIGFEPFPEFYEKCKARFASDKAVELFTVAMSDHAGKLEMYTENFNCSLQSPLNNNDRALDASHPTTTIETATLDQVFAQRFPDQTIDLLKIDVEGHEQNALNGAKGLLSSGKVKAVLIEVMFYPHFDNAWLAHEITAFLYDCGFVEHQIFDVKQTKTGQMRYGNALFIWQGKTA